MSFTQASGQSQSELLEHEASSLPEFPVSPPKESASGIPADGVRLALQVPPSTSIGTFEVVGEKAQPPVDDEPPPLLLPPVVVPPPEVVPPLVIVPPLVVPVLVGPGVTLMTVPSPQFVQYTPVGPTAMAAGVFWPVASVVTLPPLSGTDMIVPGSLKFVQ
jgi:hypothetical protein